MGDVVRLYCSRSFVNNKLTYDVLKGEWTDAGTFESLQYANKIVFKYNNRIQENRR